MAVITPALQHTIDAAGTYWLNYAIMDAAYPQIAWELVRGTKDADLAPAAPDREASALGYMLVGDCGDDPPVEVITICSTPQFGGIAHDQSGSYFGTRVPSNAVVQTRPLRISYSVAPFAPTPSDVAAMPCLLPATTPCTTAPTPPPVANLVWKRTPTSKAPAKQTRVTLGTVSACALRDTTTSASRLSCSVNDPVNYAAYRGQAYVCAPANAWTVPAFFAPLSHGFKGSATLCDNWRYLEAASQRQPSLRTQLAYDTCSNFSIVSWAKGSWYLAQDREDVSVFSWSSSHLLVGLQCAVLDVGADAPDGYWPASHNCVQAAGAYALVRPTRAGSYADFNLTATLSAESPSGSSAPLPCWGLTTTTKLPAEIAERPLTVLFNPSWEDSDNASRNTRMATISRGFGNLLATPAFVPASYNQNWRWDDKALVSGALWYAEGWGTFVP